MPTPTPGWGGSFNPSTLPQGSNPSALTVDQVNIAMRASPLWNSWMQQHGHNPANVHLNDSDKNGLAKTLELAGFPLPSGWEIDNSGNIREETHKLRNTAIVAGLTAAAVFGGPAVYSALSSGGAAGGGGAAAGGFSTGLGATGASSTAALLGGYGTVAGVGGAAGAGLGGAAASGAFDAAGNFIGPSTYGSTAGSAAGGGGIWGSLAKGYSGYKTGSSIWDNVRAAGEDASAAGLGRANARLAEARAQQEQDQLALERYRSGLQGAGVDLQQRQFGLQAPGLRAGNAVRGDILANAQDVSFSGLPPRLQGMIPTISGGLRPSMFSPATRQLGGLLSTQALEGQQKGDTFAPLPELPQPTPLPSGNAFDTALNLGGTAATLAPTFWDLLQRYRNRPKTPSDGNDAFDAAGNFTGPTTVYGE